MKHQISKPDTHQPPKAYRALSGKIIYARQFHKLHTVISIRKIRETLVKITIVVILKVFADENHIMTLPLLSLIVLNYGEWRSIWG